MEIMGELIILTVIVLNTLSPISSTLSSLQGLTCFPTVHRFNPDQLPSFLSPSPPNTSPVTEMEGLHLGDTPGVFYVTYPPAQRSNSHVRT